MLTQQVFEAIKLYAVTQKKKRAQLILSSQFYLANLLKKCISGLQIKNPALIFNFYKMKCFYLQSKKSHDRKIQKIQFKLKRKKLNCLIKISLLTKRYKKFQAAAKGKLMQKYFKQLLFLHKSQKLIKGFLQMNTRKLPKLCFQKLHQNWISCMTEKAINKQMSKIYQLKLQSKCLNAWSSLVGTQFTNLYQNYLIHDCFCKWRVTITQKIREQTKKANQHYIKTLKGKSIKAWCWYICQNKVVLSKNIKLKRLVIEQFKNYLSYRKSKNIKFKSDMVKSSRIKCMVAGRYFSIWVKGAVSQQSARQQTLALSNMIFMYRQSKLLKKYFDLMVLHKSCQLANKKYLIITCRRCFNILRQHMHDSKFSKRNMQLALKHREFRLKLVIFNQLKRMQFRAFYEDRLKKRTFQGLFKQIVTQYLKNKQICLKQRKKWLCARAMVGFLNCVQASKRKQINLIIKVLQFTNSLRFIKQLQFNYKIKQFRKKIQRNAIWVVFVNWKIYYLSRI